MVGSFQSLAKPRELICLPESQNFPLPCRSSSHLLLPQPGRHCSIKVVETKEPQNLQRFLLWWQNKMNKKKKESMAPGLCRAVEQN